MTCRAEHVGSLLRPPELAEARSAFAEGRLPLVALREAEDRAIDAALELQREAGIEVYTDGEFRRGSWVGLWLEGFEGLSPAEPAVRLQWRGVPAGIEQGELELLEPFVVAGKLRRKLPVTETEATFMAAHAQGPFKLTMASATMTATLWRPEASSQAYATPQELLEDAASLQVAEVERLIELGTRWIQLDSLRYISILDEQMREMIRSFGVDSADLLEETIGFDNRVLRAAKRKDPSVTLGVHICRGNNRSAWIAEGSYEPIAERVFSELEVDRFLLEYDTERAGGFEPLRFVPPGKTIVLGLISTKTPELEAQDDLRRRIEEAARYVPLEHLALSPQCGFASTLEGNLLTVDDQRRKLELVADTAQLIWG
jgi:methionine synthase II (cobalamin-independent)